VRERGALPGGVGFDTPIRLEALLDRATEEEEEGTPFASPEADLGFAARARSPRGRPSGWSWPAEPAEPAEPRVATPTP